MTHSALCPPPSPIVSVVRVQSAPQNLFITCYIIKPVVGHFPANIYLAVASVAHLKEAAPTAGLLQTG